MLDSSWYAVVTFNQASGRPEDEARVWGSLTEAVEDRDEMEARNRADGRREHFEVYRLEEVDDEELHEWGVREVSQGTPPLRYVSVYAAIRAMPSTGYELVKRRLGAKEWIVVDPEEVNRV